MSRASKWGMPGGGPWMILAECPSPFFHNTYSAIRLTPKEDRCICPRAMELKRRDSGPECGNGRAAEAMLLAAYLEQYPKPLRRDAVASYMRNHKSTSQPAPELTRGACRGKAGQDAMDALLDSNGNRSRKEQAMKAFCEACPLAAFRACEKYVTENEFPAGSWAGVYAGKTQSERLGRRRARGAGASTLVDAR